MPRADRVDPTRSDIAADFERLTARDQIRRAEVVATRGALPKLKDTPPLRTRCTGPGCNLSKSAFRSTAEFDLHRTLCES